MKASAYLVFLLISFAGLAQQDIDSLLKKANFELYENPGNAIRIGLSIIESKSATSSQKIDALLLVSTGYSSQRNYAKALEYAVKTAAQIPKSESDEFKFNAYSRLGLQYQQLKVYNKAHSYLDKAISIAENTKQKFDFNKLLAFNYAIRGLVYKQQMSCDIAQTYFNKALSHQKLNTEGMLNYANMSVIVYNKGNCFLSVNKIDSARACYTNAQIYADKIQANSLKAFANKGLAEVKTREGKYADAIDLLLDAERISASVGDQILNQGIYKGLADNFLLVSNRSKYELYHQKYVATTKYMTDGNAKTLNQFLAQIDAETDSEIKKIESDSLYYQIPLAAILAGCFVLLVVEIRRSKQKFRILKEQRVALEAQRDNK